MPRRGHPSPGRRPLSRPLRLPGGREERAPRGQSRHPGRLLQGGARAVAAARPQHRVRTRRVHARGRPAVYDRRVHGERRSESVLAATLAGDHGDDHFQAQWDGQQDAQVGVCGFCLWIFVLNSLF